MKTPPPTTTTKLKSFTGPTYYRGQQIFVVFCTTSVAQAAKLLDISAYTIKNYFTIRDCADDPILTISDWYKNPNKVYAYTDRGGLIEKYHKLNNVIMPIENLYTIIDKMLNDKYKNTPLYKIMNNTDDTK